MLSRDQVCDLLQLAHNAEQQCGNLFTRKEFHRFIPSDMPYADQRVLISTFQNARWARTQNLLRFSIREQIRNNVTSKS